MTQEEFAAWLTRYGEAWEARDAEAAAALFTDQAEYYWTPFGAPKRGPAEIARAWAEATSRQRDVRFASRILDVSGARGIATWHTRLVRTATGREVAIDGILVAEFSDCGRCRVFREWWHSSEDA
jgi:ketosteroid isomerase-like protein